MSTRGGSVTYRLVIVAPWDLVPVPRRVVLQAPNADAAIARVREYLTGRGMMRTPIGSWAESKAAAIPAEKWPPSLRLEVSC